MSSYRGSSYGGGEFTLALPPLTPMIKLILWTLGVAFAIQTFLQLADFGALVGHLALVPSQVTGSFQVWQLVTYGLLHGGIGHLLFNMLGIYMFGGDCERILGSRGMLTYFAVCVAGGGIAHTLVSVLTHGDAPVIGASAGVLGIVVAFAVFFPERRLFMFPIPVPISARTIAIIYAAINLYSAVTANNAGGIAFVAHLGGMLVGYVYLVAFIRPGGWGRLLRRKKAPFRVISGDRRGPYDFN